MPRILYVSPESAVSSSRKMLLKRAGYDVNMASTVENALKHSPWEEFDLVILASSINPTDRRKLAIQLKAAHVNLFDLKGRGHPSPVTEDGPEAFLRRIGEAVMTRHGHPEVEGDNVAFVDRERRFIGVTDGLLDLLGYRRDEIIGCYIDDITYPGTADASQLFHRYLSDGRQTGRYVLRHKKGHKVTVSYIAGILPDGCLYSQMEVDNS